MAPFVGELVLEASELLFRLVQTLRRLSRLFFSARCTDLELDRRSGALGEQLLRPGGASLRLLRGTEGAREALSQLAELGGGLLDLGVAGGDLGVAGRHLGVVGRPLRLEERLGMRRVGVMTEELLLELRSGAVERAGELFDQACLLGALGQELFERVVPLPSLPCEALVCGRRSVCGVGCCLLCAKNLRSRFRADRSDPRVVPRHARLEVVETSENLLEERPGAVEPALLSVPARVPRCPALRPRPGVDGEPAPSSLCPVGVRAVEPRPSPTGSTDYGHATTLEGARRRSGSPTHRSGGPAHVDPAAGFCHFGKDIAKPVSIARYSAAEGASSGGRFGAPSDPRGQPQQVRVM